MIFGSSNLTSNLVTNYDRFALAYVDPSEACGFKLLLPLEFHAVEVIHSAFESFSASRLAKTKQTQSDLGCVVLRVSQLFRRSPRAAFCHLVFISAAPPPQLSVPRVDEAIGLHTISPQPCFPFETTSHPSGWHIFRDVSLRNTDPNELYFMRKVSKVVRQLRTGLSPGAISDLNLRLVPGFECQIQSVLQDCNLKCLRPGESWIIHVQISVPPARRAAFNPEHSTPMHSHHPIIDGLIREVEKVFNEYSIKDMDRHIFTAQLEYKNSLLPATNTIHLESHCTVSRNEHTAPGASWNFETSTASTDFLDCLSGVSMGSMTESI